MMPSMLPAEIRAELAAERDRRQLALLSDVALSLHGFPLLPLTVRAWLDLVLTGNFVVRRFLVGVPAASHAAPFADLAAILWRLSPHYRPCAVSRWRTPRLAAQRLALTLRLRRMSLLPRRLLDRDLSRMLEGAFQDAPQAGDVSGRWKPLKPQAPSLPEGFVAAFGRRFGWPPAVVLDLPLAAAFALLRADDLAQGRDVVDRSATAISEWLLRATDPARN